MLVRRHGMYMQIEDALAWGLTPGRQVVNALNDAKRIVGMNGAIDAGGIFHDLTGSVISQLYSLVINRGGRSPVKQSHRASPVRSSALPPYPRETLASGREPKLRRCDAPPREGWQDPSARARSKRPQPCVPNALPRRFRDQSSRSLPRETTQNQRATRSEKCSVAPKAWADRQYDSTQASTSRYPPPGSKIPRYPAGTRN